MRVSAKSVSVLIALCVPTAWAQTHQTVASPAAPSGPIYITHVTVIDMETGKEFRDRTVHVSGDRISEVKESKDLALPTGVKIIDGTNYVIHETVSLLGFISNDAGRCQEFFHLSFLSESLLFSIGAHQCVCAGAPFC